MSNDLEIEQMIQSAGLTAPRVTQQQVDETVIAEEFHVFPQSCMTICLLTLKNGFHVTGESACASPANFNEEVGRKIALGKARDKVWMLEGYLLKQRLADGTK